MSFLFGSFVVGFFVILGFCLSESGWKGCAYGLFLVVLVLSGLVLVVASLITGGL